MSTTAITYFSCMVTTIKSKAIIEDEESWVLQGSTTQDFSATVDSPKVSMSRDFKGLYLTAVIVI